MLFSLLSGLLMQASDQFLKNCHQPQALNPKPGALSPKPWVKEVGGAHTIVVEDKPEVPQALSPKQPTNPRQQNPKPCNPLKPSTLS